MNGVSSIEVRLVLVPLLQLLVLSHILLLLRLLDNSAVLLLVDVVRPCDC